VAGYTIKNFKTDVEDQAPRFGTSPDTEARFARAPLECERVGVTYLRFAPNYRSTSGHRHKTQEEVYVVVNGSARVKVDDEIHELKQWDAIRVSKETMRAFAAGPEGVEIIAIGAPGGSGDAETIQDWWTD
jgi:mannose-6-phosphate isomerase-like protein (cupin superfamily)